MAQAAVLDENLDALISHFKQLNEQAYEKRTNNEGVEWFRPEIGDWDGDLQTEEGLKGIHKAFNTDEAEEALIDAFKPEGGNSSDGIALSLQIDYAAQAERAFRARVSQSFPRALAHYSAREKGHGQDKGALKGALIEYINLIISQGAG